MDLRTIYHRRLGWRLDFLRLQTPFSIADRLDYVLPWGQAHDVHELFARYLRRDSDGHEYFELDGRKFYFKRTDDGPATPQSLHGATIILEENFASRHSLVTDRVRPPPGGVVLDLGGNIGTTALRFADLVGPDGHVFVFEPLFHEALSRNVVANGMTNITVVPEAAGAEDGEVAFNLTEAGIDSRLATSASKGQRVNVKMTTLDTFMERQGLDRVDLVKMDIEGAEELALRGADRLIKRFRPAFTIASYHTDPWGDRQHPKLMKLLEEHGYALEAERERHIYAWQDR